MDQKIVDLNLPRLRPLEAVPSEHEGQQVVVLRDPLHLSEAVLLVPVPLVVVIQRMDGTRTLDQIREEVRRDYRLDVPRENLVRILDQLEEAHFLEGRAFEAWRGAQERAFLESPTRPSFLAGKGYEDDPAALRARIEGFFTHAEGPGLPAGAANGAPPLRGAVAPHIDFQRGGPTFAWSYRAVAERADADVFVVLGTVHAPTRAIYSLTKKPFETPLGTLEVDVPFAEALAARLAEDPYADEFAQRSEHSLEFQAVFLRYLYGEGGAGGGNGGRRPVRFVPVLVGSFGEFVAAGRSPAGDARVEGFVAGLREGIREAEARGRRVCLLASVDLAHVGPQFGDPEPVDAARLAALEGADRASLEAVCRGDAEGFYWSVAEDGDARKVCGLAPVYTMLRVLGACEGEVLRYSQWPDPNGTVTFCSVALH